MDRTTLLELLLQRFNSLFEMHIHRNPPPGLVVAVSILYLRCLYDLADLTLMFSVGVSILYLRCP